MRLSTRLLASVLSAFLLNAPLWAQQNQDPGAVPIVLDGHEQRNAIRPRSTSQVVEFTAMLPGQTYYLMVTSPPLSPFCVPDISALTPGVQVLGYDPILHQLRFVANAPLMQFRLTYACNWDPDDPPVQYASLVCESCKKKTIKEYTSAIEGPGDPLVVGGGFSAEELIKEVFIGGNCFDVTGVTLLGSPAQIGIFEGGQSNIGFPTGIIIATGDINIAPGPNDQNNAGTDVGGSSADPDLQALTTGPLFNRGGIEFQFTPTQTPLTFEYVFASEEYCEYANTGFNDVFGFFISGPGIPGGQANIAVLPSGAPVSINTVNHTTNTGFYYNNTPDGLTLCGQNPQTSLTTNELQYDGYTRKMIAQAPVIPCQTYTIKLKIADVGDGIYDSAVFLKSGSFDGGGNASAEFQVNGDAGVDVVYESCGTVTLIFDRVGGNPNLPFTVNYTISGTATPGVDYQTIPGSVTIPAGQDKVTLTIPIYVDNIIEGEETIRLKLSSPCSCINPEVILKINDLPPLNAVGDTVLICGPGGATLGVTPIGGVEPFTYRWNNGSVEPTLSPFVNVSTNYTVTVTDACGKTATAIARVIVRPLPSALLMPPAPQLCPNQEGVISINFNGVGPFNFTFTINDNMQPPVEGISQDPYAMPIFEPGLYKIVTVVDSFGCEGPGTGSLFVIPSTLSLSGVPTGVTCPGGTNGSINTTVVGGSGPMTYAWTGPKTIGNVPDPINLPAGTYNLVLTDNFGCSMSQDYIVSEPAPIEPVVVSTTGPNCNNQNGGSINIEVSGGTPGYTYAWTGGQTVQDPINLMVGNYTVTVTDTKGCTRTGTASVTGDFTPPTSIATAPNPLSCASTAVTLDGTGSSSGSGYTYNWTAGNGGNIVSGHTTLTPIANQPGTYTLLVTSGSNGCTATSTATLSSNIAYPTASAGPNQTLTCVLTSLNLNGSGSSQGTDFSYQWTATAGGNIENGEMTLTPLVNQSGVYTLQVTNNANGCTSTDQVNVNTNITQPVATIAAPPMLTCAASTVSISGSSSTPAGGISFEWSTVDGNITSGQNAATAQVSEAGTYQLLVTNNANGCTDTETTVVAQDTTIPMAAANVNEGLDCNTPSLTISGNGSSTGANFAFNWTSSSGTGFLSGQTTLNPTVNAPGTYTLLVTNLTNSCSASASVLLTQDIQLPQANAGAPATLSCVLTSLELGDPAAPLAPNLSYSWTTSGGNITAGGNTPVATINQPGTYTLLVSNSSNGCTNTASVVIPQNIVNPTAVVAPGNELNCTNPAVVLNGNGSSTGAGFQYEWTSSTGGGIAIGGSTLTPTVTGAGTYTLLVTNLANGCTATASTSVSSNADLPTALATPSGIITCVVPQINLSSAGSSSGTEFSYQWGTVNGTIVGPNNTPQINVSESGQYTLIVTNITNNCTASFNVTVADDLVNPLADAGASQILNCTVPSINLDGSASSQGNPFSYQWTASNGGVILGGGTTLNPEINEAGLYTLLVTNNDNGCTSTATVQINADANDPVVQIAAPATLNCVVPQTTLNGNGSSTGANISYAWSGPGIGSGANTLNPEINLPGNYTLVITNSTNGCTSEASVLVVQDIAIPTADAGPDFTLTCSFPQTQLGGPGNPAGAGFSFAWSGPGIVSGADTPTPVIEAPGAYAVVVTNLANGCTQTDQVQIAVNQVLPVAVAGPGFELTCIVDEYTLQTAGTSTGAEFAYTWATTNGSFLSPTNIINPTVNGGGLYYLTVTNTTNGCTSTANVQVTVSADVPVSVAGVPQTLTCAVGSLTLNAGASSTGAQYTYNWTGGAGTNIVSGGTSLNPLVNQPGIYTLVVTDNTNNCTAVSSVEISQNITAPDLAPNAGPTLTCAAPSAPLDVDVNSVGTFSYQWQAAGGSGIVNGGNTLNPTVNAGGNYILTVTNQQNGCTSTANVLVGTDFTPPPAAIQQPAILTCAATAVTLDAQASALPGATYVWSTNGGNITNQNDPLQPIVNKPGAYTLLVTNTSNGCTALASVNVAQDIQAPVADAGSNGLLTCDVTSLQLNGSQSSQGANYFYSWSTDVGQIIVGNNSLTPSIGAGGLYTLVVVNQSNGCSSTDNVQVNVNTTPPTVSIATPGLITCTQAQVTLSSSGSSGANISYAWITANGNIVSGQSSANAVVNLAGNYTLVVENNTNGCTATSSVAVADNIVLPIAEAGPGATLTCSVTALALQGSGSTGSIYTYSWTTQNGQIVSGANSLTPTVNEPGLYTLLVRNTQTGCTQTDQVNIIEETNVPTDFVPNLSKPTCKDNDGVISFTQITGGIGPFLYSINGGNSFLQTTDFSGIAPGVYDLWIQDINGCEYHETLNVPKAPDPAISIDPEFSIELGDSLQLNAILPNYPISLVQQVIWTPMDGLTFDGTDVLSLLNPQAKPFRTTEYVVRIISVDGCEAADKVFIRVNDEPAIYVPNVFTPESVINGNDRVMIFAKISQVNKVKNFQIFDRWGSMVFRAQNFQPNDPAHGWDGYFDGKLLMPAVFAYYAEVELIDGRVILLKGDVTLLR